MNLEILNSKNLNSEIQDDSMKKITIMMVWAQDPRYHKDNYDFEKIEVLKYYFYIKFIFYNITGIETLN